MSSSSITHSRHWDVKAKRAAWVVLALLVAAGLAVGAWAAMNTGAVGRLWGGGSSAIAPPPVAVFEPKALGRIEPAGDVIDIAAVMGDRLVDLTVKEGDRVTKGQALAHLDSQALRKLEVEATEDQLRETKARADAELRLAEARIAAARLALEQSHSRESEIQAEELKLPVLRQGWELAKKGRDRLAGLPDRLVSDQERERAELAVDKAKAEHDAAAKMLDRARRSNELAQKAAQADLEAAVAGKQVALSSVPQQSLQKKLELAKAQWERSVLHAPTDGTVLKVFLRPGELVGTTPILQMANLDRMVVVAQVYETDVKRIQPEQKATITSRSFRSPYDAQGLEGKVVRVGDLISQPTMRELNPLAQADRRAVEVRIELGKEASEQAKSFVHMQVDVTFPSP
jgi:HlyD family secretion protein